MTENQSTGEPLTRLPVERKPGQLLERPRHEAAASSAAVSPGGVTWAGPDESYRAVVLGETHSYITQYILSADQKAIFLFGAAAALLAVLYRDGASTRWMTPLGQWGFAGTTALVAMVGLAAAAVVAVAVVFPRLPDSQKALLSFPGIAKHESSSRYSEAFASANASVLFSDKARHCYTLARVCRSKYRTLRLAVWFEVVGVAGAALYFLFAGAPIK